MSTQQSPTPENLTEQSSTVTGTIEQHPVRERPVAIVTGASRGLGNAIARELSLRGYDLVLFARGDAGLEATAAAIASPETAVIAVQGDVANADDRERLIEATRDAFGRIDVLVNNAGIAPVTRYAHQTPEELAAVFDVNLVGPADLIRLALPTMFEQGSGRILNISSTFALAGAPYTVGYAASKAGIGALTRSLRAELRGSGVSATAAYPGPILGDDTMLSRMQNESGVTLPKMPGFKADKVARKAIRAMERGKPDVIIAPGGRLGAASPRMSEWITRKLGIVAGMEAIAGAASPPGNT